MRLSILDRFNAKWRLDDETECWLWTAYVHPDGYGWFGFDSDRGVIHASIASWLLFNGPTEGLLVLHKCDVSICVNPEHLYLGTQKDNIRDCVDRERRHEQANPPNPKPRKLRKTKLTDQVAEEIRERYRKREMNQYQLASAYGVSQPMISYIVNDRKY